MTPHNHHAASINGKFYGAGLTAVHRVARELVQAMDQIRAAQGDAAAPLEIICPESVDAPPAYQTVAVRRAGLMSGQAWEQLELPSASRGRVLLNLCNLGPVLASRAVTMIHDAQVFSTPESYAPAFSAWYRNIYRAIGRRHAIVTVSNFSSKELQRYGVADANRIAVVPNGVDHIRRVVSKPAILARHQLIRRGYVIGIANTQPHKNLRVLLRAFARPELANTKLVLFGQANAADFKRAGLALPANTVLTGPIEDGELRALLESALCTVYPSLTEGFGLPPLEGMSVGTPAIIAPLGALPETCGPSAITASPEDHADWASKITRLACEADEWRRLSSEAWTHAATYTWMKSAGTLMDILVQHASTDRTTKEQTVA